jgi:hypothetical protein
MFPMLVAIPLLVIVLAAVLCRGISPQLLGPCHALIATMLSMAMTYVLATLLVEDSRETD